jgi:hypothetical protein
MLSVKRLDLIGARHFWISSSSSSDTIRTMAWFFRSCSVVMFGVGFCPRASASRDT